jgi:hypothetical protein
MSVSRSPSVKSSSLIHINQFTVPQEDDCTSSVMDVFTSLHSVVKAVNDLKWTDPQRHADFVAEVALVSYSFERV